VVLATSFVTVYHVERKARQTMKVPRIPSCAALASLLISGALAERPQQVTRIAYDYTAMYEAMDDRIVKVHVDGGSGSGFLVRGDGIIATNHHVVRNSRYVAVEFSSGRKLTATVVDLDSRNDLALLKVNASTVQGLQPLPLLPVERDATVRAGMPVVAFGSPLSETFLMTQGIVSKVESAVLLGDFLIEPGNSGGPLLNLDGVVIGVNTFANGRIAGAVRISVVRSALSRLGERTLPEPSPEPLPAVRQAAYPTDVLKTKILSEPLDMKNYQLDGGRFTITALTPVLFGKVQVQSDLQQAANRYSRRARKISDERYDPVDEPFYDWLRSSNGILDYVVRLEAKPNFGQTTGSLWASVLSGVSAGLAGTTATPTHQTMEFKAEFADLQLFRDGQLVQPIKPGREITEQALSSQWLTFVDEAYSGVYVYAPEVFLTGSEWQLNIYDAREPGTIHRSIRLDQQSKLIQHIRRDFAGADRPARTSVPLETIAGTYFLSLTVHTVGGQSGQTRGLMVLGDRVGLAAVPVATGAQTSFEEYPVSGIRIEPGGTVAMSVGRISAGGFQTGDGFWLLGEVTAAGSQRRTVVYEAVRYEGDAGTDIGRYGLACDISGGGSRRGEGAVITAGGRVYVDLLLDGASPSRLHAHSVLNQGRFELADGRIRLSGALQAGRLSGTWTEIPEFGTALECSMVGQRR
jgi:hypothetical protein